MEKETWKYQFESEGDFYEWLKNQPDYGICAPPLEPQTAVLILCDYLLGKDWYSYNPVSQGQVNTEIVCDILMKYSRRFRRERRKMLREHKKRKRGVDITWSR
jgi:hypothetical protein